MFFRRQVWPRWRALRLPLLARLALASLAAAGGGRPLRAEDSLFARAIGPTDAISGEDLRRGGVTQLGVGLEEAMVGFNFPRPSIADGTDDIRPVTLRGLAPDQMLVLVNGRRWHPSALLNINNSIGRGSVSTDFNSIPLGAIARVEVLRTAATALYGTNTLAGVVNLVLREDLGAELDTFWGGTGDGGGEVRLVNAEVGAKLGTGGFLHASASYRRQDATNRTAPDTRQQYFGRDLTTGAPLPLSGNYLSGTTPAPAGTAFDPREAAVDRANHRQGDPRDTHRALVLNAALPSGSAGEFTGFAQLAKRDGEGPGYFRRPGDDATVRALWPNGFLPLIGAGIVDWALSAGYRTNLAEGHFDLGVISGGNSLAYTVRNTDNASLGAASPTHFDSGELKAGQTNVTAEYSRSFDLGHRRPLDLNAGLDYSYETFRITAGEPASWRDGGASVLDGPDAGSGAPQGAQGFPGFQPNDARAESRQSGAVHLGLDQEFNPRLRANVQVRGARAGQAGSAAATRAGLQYTPLPGFSLRASVGSGFRFPSLEQLWFSSTATNFIGGVPFQNRTFAANDPVAKALGQGSVTPAHTTDATAGLVFTPTPAFSAAIDAYQIDVHDRIVLSSNFVGSAVSTFLASRGLSGATGGRFLTNAVDTRTTGADVTARYSLDLGTGGRLKLTAAYSHNQTSFTRIAPTPSALAALGVTTPIFDLTE